MNIELFSDKYQVIGINKKSTAEMFCNLKLGSLIKFEVELKARDKRGCATYVTVTNLSTKEFTSKSFNQIPKILESFELAKCSYYKDVKNYPDMEDIMGVAE